MISLFISLISIFLWLAIKVIIIGFILILELCTLMVNLIVGLIGLCLHGSAAASTRENKPVATSKPIVINKPVKNSTVRLSRRQRKAIDKKIKREIRRAQDDLEYDMLMMAEVCAND